METAVGYQTKMHLQRLNFYSQQEADELFEQLPFADVEQLSGVYRGRLFAVKGFDWLPRILRSLLYGLLGTWVNPWKGKYFQQGFGANIWLLNSSRVQFGHYKTDTQADTLTDNGNPFLNYDIEKNWRLLRGIRGEARILSDNLILARMNYVTAKKVVRVLYFTLEK